MIFAAGLTARHDVQRFARYRTRTAFLSRKAAAMQPPSPSAPRDRRSMRTRNALRDALIGLIGERGWDDIAVQDICERADIGRSTFYSHYPNKDALLLGSLDDLRQALVHQAAQRSGGPRHGAGQGFHFALGLIEHAHEQRKIFRGLIGRRSGFVVQQRFKEMVVRLVADELPSSAGNLPREAVARWIGAAFVELLAWWVEQRSPMPPEDLAALFHRMSRPLRESAA